MRKWKLKLKEYGISASRYDELIAFCRQYPEWKGFVNSELGQPQSPIVSDMPKSPNSNQDKLLALVAKRIDCEKKMKIVEETAYETDQEFSQYLIENICFNTSITCLQMQRNMPLGANEFYKKRRYFFYLLDRKKS